MEARLAQAMMSIPATKGFEIGSGFAGHPHDRFAAQRSLCKKRRPSGHCTNYSGGVQGGISQMVNPSFSGWPLNRRRPLAKRKHTVDFEGNEVTLEAKGRHDPCVVPRAVPIVESMAALVIADLALQQRTDR